MQISSCLLDSPPTLDSVHSSKAAVSVHSSGVCVLVVMDETCKLLPCGVFVVGTRRLFGDGDSRQGGAGFWPGGPRTRGECFAKMNLACCLDKTAPCVLERERLDQSGRVWSCWSDSKLWSLSDQSV